MNVKLEENFYSDKESIEILFGHLFNDVDDFTEREFNDCISFSNQKNWGRWKNAWEDWKNKGFIPFVEE